MRANRKGAFSLLFLSLVSCQGPNSGWTDEENVIANTRVVVVSLWDESRFGTTFGSANFFKSWDASKNGLLGEQEFARSFYRAWDLNDDNKLDENEWDRSVNIFRLEDQTWAGWDTVASGNLDMKEFRLGFEDVSWYTDWDLNEDNNISEDEYAEGLFGLFDKDANGLLNEKEYKLFHTYFGKNTEQQ